MFDNEFPTVTFIIEGTIQPNWKNLVQLISHKSAQENIDLKDTWSLQISRKIPDKPQVMIRVSLKIIPIKRSHFLPVKSTINWDVPFMSCMKYCKVA